MASTIGNEKDKEDDFFSKRFTLINKIQNSEKIVCNDNCEFKAAITNFNTAINGHALFSDEFTNAFNQLLIALGLKI